MMGRNRYFIRTNFFDYDTPSLAYLTGITLDRAIPKGIALFFQNKTIN